MSDRPPGTLVGTLQLFAEITRFRKGPEDLPVSGALLAGCVVVGVGAQALLLSVMPIPFTGSPLALLVIDTVVTLLFISGVLNLAKCPERFLQTATAVFGFQLVILPLAMAVGWLFLVFSADPVWGMPVYMLRVALEIWGLAVTARILSSATGWTMFSCVMLTIAVDLLSIFAMASLVSVPAAPVTPA